MRNHKLYITIIISFLIIIAALYVFAFVIPDISGALTPTYIVKNATIETSYKVECVVVRDEIPYFSENGGNVTYYIEESEKTRINTRIVDIYNGSSKNSMYCKKTGFVSYFYDGYEQVLTPETVVDMDPNSYLEIIEQTESKTNDKISRGDFVYKLVDGSAWYLMIPVNEEQLKTFRMGANLNIYLEDGTNFTAVSQRVLGEDSFVVMAKVTSYYPDFAKFRKLNVKVVTSETYGLLIPNTAITTNDDGKEGVFVLGTDGEYHFTRIQTLLVDGENTLVKESQFTEYYEDGTSKQILSLDLYDEIKRNAEN